MNSNLPHVSIIILNWNGWKDTIECLESVHQLNYPNYSVILVDNASTDNSVINIRKYCEGNLNIESNFITIQKKNKPINIFEVKRNYQQWSQEFKDKDLYSNLPSNRKLILILNNKNYMFTIGNNIAIRFVLENLDSEFCFLLNNDTVIETNVLLELINLCLDHCEIGVIGPRICDYYNPKLNQWKNYSFNSNSIIDVEFVSGAAFLFKMELTKIIGLLDPRYIHYAEDKDFCRRARKAGYRIVYFHTKNKVLHKISVATDKISGMLLYFKTRNTFLFKRKFLNNLQFFLFFCRFFMITFFLELKRYPKERRYLFKGIKYGIVLLLKDKSLLLGKKP